MFRNSNGTVDTTLESYRAVMEGVAAVQKQSMMFALGWIEKQAEINLRMVEMMMGQARRQQEASRVLVEGSVRVFDELPHAASTDAEERSLPIDRYDRLSIEEISTRLEQLDARGVEELKNYEVRHKNRLLLLERLDRALV
ncbi:MAG TPA: hypothetical protein VF068_13155 [Rubrobacter sp.]